MVHSTFTVVCEQCGKEYETASYYHRWCLVCKVLQARQRAKIFEQQHRHACPDCGVEIARCSKRCRDCGKKSRIAKITGPGNYAWKGGRRKDQFGYILIRIGPGENGKQTQYRPEHILVWEAANGSLPRGFIVHHINHIKDDNRLENLEAMPRSQHNHRHGEQRILELEAEITRLRDRLDGNLHS